MREERRGDPETRDPMARSASRRFAAAAETIPSRAPSRADVSPRGTGLEEEEIREGPLVAGREDGEEGAGRGRAPLEPRPSRVQDAPPPSVPAGEGRRRMKRSPGRAATGDSRKTCANAVSPGAKTRTAGPSVSARPAGPARTRDSRPATSAVPRWTRTRIPSARGSLESGQDRHFGRQDRGRLEGALRNEGLAAPQVRPVDSREVQARPLAREGLAPLLAVHLDPPHAGVTAPRGAA